MQNIKLIQLSKSDTKAAEPVLVSIFSLFFSEYYKRNHEEQLTWLAKETPNPESIEDLIMYWVLKWYTVNNFSPVIPLTAQDEVISTILGIKPQYHVIYQNYRTAVWGFKIEGCDAKIIIYNSRRGTMIFSEASLSKECGIKLLRHLTRL